eukprot:GHVL01022692.1.p1 GENE.GHVL01022692.1~~GHVL01022692.1.p1  ORF type:complete len:1102 (+),score=155.04 GHVL01022692.1:257-3562(+)
MNNIKVAVRVRPFLPREHGDENIISMSGASVTLFDKDHYSRTYQFDRCFWSFDNSQPFASQQDVYERLGEVILENALEGYNGCLFAYGQTGSGKSHSIIGRSDDPGLIPRFCDNMFQKAIEMKGESELRVTMSYIEIYNERIHDLLIPQKQSVVLDVLQHPKLGTFIPNLTATAVVNYEEVGRLMDFGNKKRSVAVTNMNSTSSRSHAVAIFQLTRIHKSGVLPKKSTVNLVDLAGSERHDKTEFTKERIKEGNYINSSLTYLGLVISRLCENQKLNNPLHVPFRASKLTFLLSDSLSGNSRTFMLANISPAKKNYQETLSTLRFATSVKKVLTKARINHDHTSDLVKSLYAEIAKLKAELPRAWKNKKESEAADIMAEVKVRERLIEELGVDWQEKIKIAQTEKEKRDLALEDMGLTTKEIQDVFQIEQDVPYLINISDDPLLSGCLMYFLKTGQTTTIGSGTENSIVLEGLGMIEQICAIFNSENNSDLNLIGSGSGRVLVNGRPTNGTCEIKHHDRIVLGRAHAFRVVIPSQQKQLQDRRDSTAGQVIDMNWINTEVMMKDRVDEGIRTYMEETQDRIGPERAHKFLMAFKECSRLVDEANDMTKEMLPDSGLYFSPETIVNIFTYRNDDPEMVVRLLKKVKEQDPIVEHVWEMSKFTYRLEAMRQLYRDFLACRESWIKPTLQDDPWIELRPSDLAEIIDTAKTSAIMGHQEIVHEMNQNKKFFTAFNQGKLRWLKANALLKVSDIVTTGITDIGDVVRLKEAHAQAAGAAAQLASPNSDNALQYSNFALQSAAVRAKATEIGKKRTSISKSPQTSRSSVGNTTQELSDISSTTKDPPRSSTPKLVGKTFSQRRGVKTTPATRTISKTSSFAKPLKAESRFAQTRDLPPAESSFMSKKLTSGIRPLRTAASTTTSNISHNLSRELSSQTEASLKRDSAIRTKRQTTGEKELTEVPMTTQKEYDHSPSKNLTIKNKDAVGVTERRIEMSTEAEVTEADVMFPPPSTEINPKPSDPVICESPKRNVVPSSVEATLKELSQAIESIKIQQKQLPSKLDRIANLMEQRRPTSTFIPYAVLHQDLEAIGLQLSVLIKSTSVF